MRMGMRLHGICGMRNFHHPDRDDSVKIVFKLTKKQNFKKIQNANERNNEKNFRSQKPVPTSAFDSILHRRLFVVMNR